MNLSSLAHQSDIEVTDAHVTPEYLATAEKREEIKTVLQSLFEGLINHATLARTRYLMADFLADLLGKGAYIHTPEIQKDGLQRGFFIRYIAPEETMEESLLYINGSFLGEGERNGRQIVEARREKKLGPDSSQKVEIKNEEKLKAVMLRFLKKADPYRANLRLLWEITDAARAEKIATRIPRKPATEIEQVPTPSNSDTYGRAESVRKGVRQVEKIERKLRNFLQRELGRGYFCLRPMIGINEEGELECRVVIADERNEGKAELMVKLDQIKIPATTPGKNTLLSIKEAKRVISQALWISESSIVEERIPYFQTAGCLRIGTGREAIKLALLCDDKAIINAKGVARAKEYLMQKIIRYMADRQVRDYRGKRVRTTFPK